MREALKPNGSNGLQPARRSSPTVPTLPITESDGEGEFPGEAGDLPLTKGDLCSFRIGARDAAGIVEAAWLHDVRHTHAVIKGESLHVSERLLATVELLQQTPTSISTTRR